MDLSANNWIPIEYSKGGLLDRFRQASAVEQLANAGGRVETMNALTIKVPKRPIVNVGAVGKKEDYPLNDTEPDEMELRARKIGAMEDIAEEDMDDSKTYVDTIKVLREGAIDSSALYLDNACLGVTGAASTGETNITKPFESVYYSVKTNVAGNVDTIARASNAAAYRTAFLEMVGLAEESAWANDLVVVANTAFRTAIRGLSIDGSDGASIFNEALNQVLSYPVYWTRGARTSSIATYEPTGNPLMIIGPRKHFVLGNRWGLEWFLSDPRVGVGMRNDTAFLKVRQRKAFHVGEESAFAILEQTA